MKCWVLIVLLLGLAGATWGRNQHGVDTEDNEFAEFEDFEDASEPVQEVREDEEDEGEDASEFESEQLPSDDEEEDAVVETEEEDFDVLDPDEFEGLPGDDSIWEGDNEKIRNKKPKKKSEPELKIADVPLHLRSWDKYYVEILMVVGLSIYLLNFFIGKTRNNTIASAWLQAHIDFLAKQFVLVGDDPTSKQVESTMQLVKDAEHNYTLWCSGRQCCEGMLVEIKLLKRQDIISVISNRLKPVTDQVTMTITMSGMDPFVFCAGTKKAVAGLHKNMQDVSVYCTERSRTGDKYGLSPNMVVLSEMYGEVPNAILNDKVVKIINDAESSFESVLISDQFSGPVPVDQEEQSLTKPETEKVIILTLNLPKKKTDSLEPLVSLLKMVVYLIDRVRKYKLSRENKAKADRHRQEALAKYLKQTHAQRQEAAQLKKEEKEKALKDRMMNEEDPEKQRRMDEQLHKREVSRKNKKMMKGRQFKVKAM